MENSKGNKIKYLIIGVVLFALGIFVGNQVTYGTHKNLQGYLYNAPGVASDSNASNSNASSSNASSSNASSSNASSSNASSSNASSANASSGNVNTTDNIIFLDHFELNRYTVEPGQRVDVSIRTSGAYNTGASVIFKSEDGTTFTVQIEDLNENPYIVVPPTTIPKFYRVIGVLLVGRNSDNTTFTKQYNSTYPNSYHFTSAISVIPKTEPTEKIVLSGLSFESASVKAGETVYLNIQVNEEPKNLTMVSIDLTSSDNKRFTAFVKDIEEKPYIEIPSYVEPGTYSVTSAVFANENGSSAYSINGAEGTEKFGINATIEILEGTGDSYVYNNEDITSEIYTKIYNAPAGSRIIVNANSNSIINEELFKAIKGQNKKLIIYNKYNQMVFKGEDITTPKTIDVAMNIYKVSEYKSISKLVSKGIVVSFPDNGNLPGKAQVRIKSIGKINSTLGDKVYVYIFNSSSKNFCTINLNVQKSNDGYYEFEINHNSAFLLTNEKLPDDLVVAENKDNVVSFLKSNKVYLLLIAIGIIVIIAIIIVIIILKKKKNSATPASTKEEIKVPTEETQEPEVKDNKE